MTAPRPPATRAVMSVLTPDPIHGAAIGLDHVGIVGMDLDALAAAFVALGFALTPYALHASGRTGNRCVMLRDGGYLELIATVPGRSSATMDRFLARGAGAHVLALEVADEAAAMERLRRAGIAADLSIAERGVATGENAPKARFAVILPHNSLLPGPLSPGPLPPGPLPPVPLSPDPLPPAPLPPARCPDPLPHGPPAAGRVLLIRQLTRDLLWRPSNTVHPNWAAALTEAVYASDAPAKIMASMSRLAGRPAEPDPLGGYRIRFSRGCVRMLPHAAAAGLFPGATGARR